MTPKKAEEILDSLGIEYEKVSMAHVLMVKLPDGSRIAFKKLLREHSKNVSSSVSQMLFAPTEDVSKPVDNEVSQAETEIIKKPRSKSKR